MANPTIGVIGAGRVGATLAQVWHQRGYRLSAIYNRTPDKAIRLAEETNSIVAESVTDVIDASDLIMLSVSDDAIESVAGLLADCDWSSRGIFHVSGAKSLDDLRSIRDMGGMVGSLHPAFPFAEIKSSIDEIVGATFALESSHDSLKGWLHDLVGAIDGRVIEIPAGKKAQYHTALVFASNYMVTLYAIAQNLLNELSEDQDAIHHALYGLMTTTLSNLGKQGIPDALTGPLVRSDTGTIRDHLLALKHDKLTLDTYINLARLSYPMLHARGIDSHVIETLFRQDNSHASNDT